MHVPTPKHLPSGTMTDTLAIEVLVAIMTTLSITSGIRVMTPHSADIWPLIIAALTTNTAWGFVDGVLHLFNEQVSRTRELRLQQAFMASTSPPQRRMALTQLVPEHLSACLSDAQIHAYQETLATVTVPSSLVQLRRDDCWMALRIWALMVLSTIPPVLPLVLIDAPITAFRVSQLVSVAIMFALGIPIARWTGIRPWVGGVIFAMLGTAITVICIAMGG